MKYTFVFFSILLISISISSAATIGTDRYVSIHGNDNNPGTEAQPWRTIQKAADTAVAGDTVYVKNGIYNEQVWIKNSGSPDNWITFTSYPGDTVTVDGNGKSVGEWQGLINIIGKDYIKISGFSIVNSQWAGILVSKDYSINERSSYITIEGNHIYKAYSSGIVMQHGDNYVVDSNGIIIDSLKNTFPDVILNYSRCFDDESEVCTKNFVFFNYLSIDNEGVFVSYSFIPIVLISVAMLIISIRLDRREQIRLAAKTF